MYVLNQIVFTIKKNYFQKLFEYVLLILRYIVFNSIYIPNTLINILHTYTAVQLLFVIIVVNFLESLRKYYGLDDQLLHSTDECTMNERMNHSFICLCKLIKSTNIHSFIRTFKLKITINKICILFYFVLFYVCLYSYVYTHTHTLIKIQTLVAIKQSGQIFSLLYEYHPT